jgi:hypothetical protein
VTLDPHRRRRAGALLLVALLCPAAAVAVPDGAELVRQAERAWSARAGENGRTGRADPAAAERAERAFAAAARAAPEDLALRMRWIEALYFAAEHAAAEPDVRRRHHETMVALAGEAVAGVERGAGCADCATLPPEARAARLAQAPLAAEAHFWSAVAWGVWALSHGNAAAFSHGVAGLVRDHATVVLELDPRWRDGAAPRILGRMHTVAPRVPFVTGWVDRAYGIELLGRAHAISTAEPRNALILAEALLRHAPARRDEALALARATAARAPRADRLVEDAAAIEQARSLLHAQDH